MKHRLSIFLNSALIKKMILRLILIEMVVLIALLVGSRFILMPHIRDRAVQSTSESLHTLCNLVDNQLSQYVNYSQLIINTASIQDCIQQYNNLPSEQNAALLSLALTEQFPNKSNIIRGVFLEGPDGTLFHSVANLRESDLGLLQNQGYCSVREGNNTHYFSALYQADVTTQTDFLAYSRNYYTCGSRYVLTLLFDAADLTDIVNASADLYTGLAIRDIHGKDIFCSGDLGRVGDLPVLNLTNTKDGCYFYAPLHTYSWSLVSYQTNDALVADYLNIFYTAILLCAIVSLILVLIAIPCTAHIISPIHDLSLVMTQASEGDLNVVCDISRNDELGQLSEIFNQMLQNLRENTQRQIAFEANEQRMRYNLLLSQIDAHFIGNTMSTINAFARQGKTAEVIALNTALLKILQNNLRVRDIDICDTIAQEIEIVEQYWTITKLRQDNHVELAYEVPDELLEEIIPKNILQPLVENCLFHGLVDEETGEIHGHIWIRVFDQPDTIRIQVQDDGVGIPPERLSQLNRGKAAEEYLQESICEQRGRHIGLENIRQRLQFFYRRNCLTITSENGTCVTLDIPKRT